MKLIPTTLVVGVIVVTALYLTHQGVFYKRPEKTNEEKVITNASSQEVYGHVVSPQIFIDVLQNNDSNYIAGVFNDISLQREKTEDETIFACNTCNYTFQKIYSYDDIPYRFFYVFIGKMDANLFLDSLKSYGGSKPIMEEKYPSYKIGDCSFVNKGYNINNNGYTFCISYINSSLNTQQKTEDKLNHNSIGSVKKKATKKKEIVESVDLFSDSL